MSKFLTVVPGDKLAGAEKVLSLIAAEFYQKGMEIYIIIWYIDKDKTGQWDKWGDIYNIIEIENSSFSGLITLKKTIKKLSKIPFDIVVSSNITLNSILGVFRKLGVLRTSKLIVREPSSPFIRYKNKKKLLSYKIKYLLGYKYVDFIIFQTNKMESIFRKNIKNKIKGAVLPNPLEYEKIKSLSTQYSNLNYDNKPYIISAGRFIPEKGFDLLIAGFNKIENKSIKLILLGSGPLEGELKQQVKDLNLEDRVFFPGFIQNPFPYFKKATCCIISSRIEGFPNTLLQMLTLNNKVISTKCCGDLEDIPGIFLIEPNSEIILTKAIDSVLKEDINVDRNIIDSYLINRNPKNYIGNLLTELNKL